MALGPNLAGDLFLLIKFYWHPAMPICSLTICGWFCATKAELRHCKQDVTAHKAKNIICMSFYRKCMLILCPEEWLAAWVVHFRQAWVQIPVVTDKLGKSLNPSE